MAMTDPISDFLTRLRNAAKAQHQDVTIPSSNVKREIARILKEQGYIDDWAVHAAREDRPGEEITITLKYTEQRKPVITGLQRVSRPGRRNYVNHGHIPRIQGGMGTTIISTSQGLMTGHDARIQGIGGEVVAKVW